MGSCAPKSTVICGQYDECDVPYESLLGFEKECQDFLQMIQEDGGAAPDLSFLDTICSSDMTGTSTSSMLSSGEDSIGCVTDFSLTPLALGFPETPSCIPEAPQALQLDAHSTVPDPASSYQACEGLLGEAERWSGLANGGTVPMNYFGLLTSGSGEAFWTTPGSNAAKRKRIHKSGGKVGRPRKDPKLACIRIFKETLRKGGLLLQARNQQQAAPAAPSPALQPHLPSLEKEA